MSPSVVHKLADRQPGPVTGRKWPQPDTHTLRRSYFLRSSRVESVSSAWSLGTAEEERKAPEEDSGTWDLFSPHCRKAVSGLLLSEVRSVKSLPQP